MKLLKPKRLYLLVSLLGVLLTAQAQRVALKTNMLYDVVVVPSIGLEASVVDKWSLALSGSYGWLEGSPWHDNIRVVTGDAELRYWLTGTTMQRGLHAGVYGAVYRYDFLFGSKGEEAKANWGTGVTCGYAVSIDRHFSIDFSIGIGYVGGKYQSYTVSDDVYRHNVWTANKVRRYIGPTKAEISLVWNLCGTSKNKKGGGR